MTVVLVHGNPETEALWDPLSERLDALGYDDQAEMGPVPAPTATHRLPA